MRILNLITTFLSLSQDVLQSVTADSGHDWKLDAVIVNLTNRTPISAREGLHIPVRHHNVAV